MRFRASLNTLAAVSVALALAVVMPPRALAAPSPARELSALTLAADNLLTNENLVLTTPTKLHVYNFRRAILITNNGPNRIWCALGASSLAVIGKAQPIDANGGFWSLPLPPSIDIWCIAETANQVTLGGTTTAEVP